MRSVRILGATGRAGSLLPALGAVRCGGTLLGTPCRRGSPLTATAHASGAALTGAKEEALDAFLGRRIVLTQMAEIVERILDIPGGGTGLPSLGPEGAAPALGDVLVADRLARARAAEAIAKRGRT